MTKYLINLVCIIGIAGAAHAGAVADLQITADGHAYLVFAAGAGDLTGYSIEDLLSTGSWYDPDVAIPDAGQAALTLQSVSTEAGGTGQYATAWSSLAIQGPTSGASLGNLAEPKDWFVEGDSINSSYIAEVNVGDSTSGNYANGALARADGVPVYIGQILDPVATMGGLLEAADFTTGGRLANLRFRTADNSETVVVATGAISLLVSEALVAGSTDFSGVAYQETSLARSVTPRADDPVGKVGTRIDAAYVGGGDTAVIDLEVVDAGTPVIDGANTVTTTAFLGEGVRGAGLADGNLMINGKMLPINYADIVEINDTVTGAFVSAHLRIQAIDGASTIAIDTDFTQTGLDVLGVNGTLGSTMVISLVPGDFDFDGVSGVSDIDLITALAATPEGLRSLLFDVNNADHIVDISAAATSDREKLILELVDVTGGIKGTLHGDYDLNGEINLGDYSTWADNFGLPNRTWATADFNGNGETDLGDYSYWADNYLQGPNDPVTVPVAAPEPATMTLLVMGALGLVRRRRRA